MREVEVERGLSEGVQDHLPGREEGAENFCKGLALWDSIQLLGSLMLKREIGLLRKVNCGAHWDRA